MAYVRAYPPRLIPLRPPVRLEFVVRPPLGAAPSPGSGRPNGTLFSSARATMWPPAKIDGVWPFNGRVAAYLVVGGLEVGKCPFKITGMPEQHRVETFSPRRSDQALHEGVGPGHMRHGLDFVDLQNPQVRCPTMRLEQRIMIGAEMSRGAPPMHGGVAHAAEVGAIDRTAVHADSDEAARALVP